jgi:hypothetical protein
MYARLPNSLALKNFRAVSEQPITEFADAADWDCRAVVNRRSDPYPKNRMN